MDTIEGDKGILVIVLQLIFCVKQLLSGHIKYLIDGGQG